MAAGYSDNLEAVLGDLDAEFPTEDHTLEQRNSAEYARPLHDKHGFYVFNPEHAIEMTREFLQQLIDSPQPLSDRNVKRALDYAGYADTNFLLSFSGELRPPAKAGEGGRQARMGSWADISGQLAGGYSHQIDGGPIRDDYE